MFFFATADISRSTLINADVISEDSAAEIDELRCRGYIESGMAFDVRLRSTKLQVYCVIS